MCHICSFTILRSGQIDKVNNLDLVVENRAEVAYPLIDDHDHQLLEKPLSPTHVRNPHNYNNIMYANIPLGI